MGLAAIAAPGPPIPGIPPGIPIPRPAGAPAPGPAVNPFPSPVTGGGPST